jgi:hypothetical protein
MQASTRRCDSWAASWSSARARTRCANSVPRPTLISSGSAASQRASSPRIAGVARASRSPGARAAPTPSSTTSVAPPTSAASTSPSERSTVASAMAATAVARYAAAVGSSSRGTK